MKPNAIVHATIEISLAVFIIIVITIIHILLLSPSILKCSVILICPENSVLSNYYDKVSGIGKSFSGAFTILLLYITYALFCKIAKTVIKNFDTDGNPVDMNKKQIKDDIENGLQYTDNPTRIIFLLLTVFAFILCHFKVYEGMEMFFSGAIAFELILSAIAWVNTDTA